MDISNLIKTNYTKISDGFFALAKEKDGCRKCSVYDDYKQVVHSEGNAYNPTFVFVGEAPGQDEQEKKRPFIGKAGQRFREELRKHHKVFNKNTCLLTNVVSCRPLNNVFPSKANVCCDAWLTREIKLLKPKIIITVGSKALMYVRGQNGIKEHHAEWVFSYKYNCWTYAIYHPSYVLRCKNDMSKQYIEQEFVDDIKTLAKSWSFYSNPCKNIKLKTHPSSDTYFSTQYLVDKIKKETQQEEDAKFIEIINKAVADNKATWAWDSSDINYIVNADTADITTSSTTFSTTFSNNANVFTYSDTTPMQELKNIIKKGEK